MSELTRTKNYPPDRLRAMKAHACVQCWRRFGIKLKDVEYRAIVGQVKDQYPDWLKQLGTRRSVVPVRLPDGQMVRAAYDPVADLIVTFIPLSSDGAPHQKRNYQARRKRTKGRMDSPGARRDWEEHE